MSEGKCNFKMTRGDRKGLECDKKTASGTRCAYHKEEYMKKQKEKKKEGKKEEKVKDEGCGYVYKIGVFKGDKCGRKVYAGGRCGKHNEERMERKKRKKLTREMLFKLMNEYKVRTSEPPHNHEYNENTLNKYYSNFKRITRECFGFEQSDKDVRTDMFCNDTKVEICVRDGQFTNGARKEMLEAVYLVLRALGDEHNEAYKRKYGIYKDISDMETVKKDKEVPDIAVLREKADKCYDKYTQKPMLKNLVYAAVCYAYTETPCLRSSDVTTLVFGEKNTTEEYPNYITDDLSEIVLNVHKTTERVVDPNDKTKYLREVRVVKIGEKLRGVLEKIRAHGTIYAFPRSDLGGNITNHMVSKITKRNLGFTPNDTRKTGIKKCTDGGMLVDEYLEDVKKSGHSAYVRMSVYEGSKVVTEKRKVKRV